MTEVIVIERADAEETPELLEQLKEPFLFEYFGKKEAQLIKRKWFAGEIFVAPKIPVWIERDLALKLMAENFGNLIYREYQEDPLKKRLREVQEKEAARKAALEAELAAQSESFDPSAIDLSKIDFETSEIEGEPHYLCPFCEKTYKVNEGKGKRFVLQHLEKEHAEEWQAALKEKMEEQQA